MRILVVDDDPAVSGALQRALRLEGYEVTLAGDGPKALEEVAIRPPDAVVLDIGLPTIDGLDVCRRMRAAGDDTPVLMLTARDAIDDRVQGLDAGADDYLVKPFAFAELLARIRTLLRRPPQTLATELRVGDLALDPAARTVRRGDQPIELTSKEFALLELFMRSPGEVLSRDTILDHAWDEDADAFSNVVDVYVRRLRKKIDRAGEPSRFQTVRGVGYGIRA